MEKKAAATDQIYISERDGEKQVVLHPGDNDLFVRTGKQVIEASRLGISLEVWFDEFASMLRYVEDWSKTQERVRSCFCAPRGARVMLFFVPRSESFDFDLGDQLAELGGYLIKTFNVGMVEVRQIPWDEMDRFIDIETARHIYGERPGPYQPVSP